MIDRNGDSQLELRTEAVLFWSNPVRGGETNGSVFVWTHDGRAELVGTVFSHLVRNVPDRKHIAHSFHSLSLAPMQAAREGAEAWSAPDAGIQPEPIPDAPRRTDILKRYPGRPTSARGKAERHGLPRPTRREAGGRLHGSRLRWDRAQPMMG